MNSYRQLPSISGVATGGALTTHLETSGWRATVQVVVTGVLTLTLEASLNGTDWVAVSGTLTASAFVGVSTAIGPVKYLRLRSTAGTGSAVAYILEVN